MITINVPESIKEKAEDLKAQGLAVEIITDTEYIKRFGRTSLENLLNAQKEETK